RREPRRRRPHPRWSGRAAHGAAEGARERPHDRRRRRDRPHRAEPARHRLVGRPRQRGLHAPRHPARSCRLRARPHEPEALPVTTTAPSPTTETYLVGHWVDGAQIEAEPARTAPVFNPATGAQVGRVALAGAEEVDAAVRSAVAAQRVWGGLSLAKRAAVLFRFRELLAAHTDELARVISREHGKVLSDARGEVARGLEVVEYACGLPQLLKGELSDEAATGIEVFTTREPLGVVVGGTPFNFPAMVPLWMSPVAIASVNAIILMPLERDPSAANVLARLWQEAGLPDGVFSVVHGDKDTVTALISHDDVAAVSFVGSTPIARSVHATATAAGKRVQALGGAKNHGVVLADADLSDAADHLTAAAYGSAGERCMALSVAAVAAEVADELVA